MRDIKNYEGLYAVTSCGKVWSYRKKKFLSPGLRRGYKSVVLCNSEGKKNYVIHRLVAEAYLPNPDNLPQVNHKDENKLNNNINNLEWCSVKENINYGTRTQRMKKSQGKMVYCKEKKTIYESITAAGEDLGIRISNISNVCNGKQKTAHNLHFYFLDENRIKMTLGAVKEISEYNELSEEQVRIVEALVNTLG